MTMVTLRRPLCALFDAEATPSDGVCFEYAQSAQNRSAFYAIPSRPMAMQCNAAMVLAFVLCAPRRSTF